MSNLRLEITPISAPLKRNFFYFCFPLRAERCAEDDVLDLKLLNSRLANKTGTANFKFLNPLHI